MNLLSNPTAGLVPVSPFPPPPAEPYSCASPGCRRLVVETWEESGLLCAACAVEEELKDRVSRWERIYPGC